MKSNDIACPIEVGMDAAADWFLLSWDHEAKKAAEDAKRCYGVLSDESELAFYRSLTRNYIKCVSDTPDRYYPFNYLDDAFGGGD